MEKEKLVTEGQTKLEKKTSFLSLPRGAFVIKLFAAVINTDGVISSVMHFNPSLLYVGKARRSAIQLGHPLR
jgi:hypothetical protein